MTTDNPIEATYDEPAARGLGVAGRGLDGARAFVTAHAVPVLATALALLAVGSVLPWSTFDIPYPGGVEAAGLGGHRIYLLVLGLVTPVALTRLPGRRRAARSAALAAVSLAVIELVWIAHDGGGLGAVALGAWLGVLGAAGLLAVASTTTPIEPRAWGRPARVVDIALPIVTVAVGLAAVYVGFEIESAQVFTAFLVFVFGTAGALAGIGYLEAVSAAWDRHTAISTVVLFLAIAAFPLTQNGDATWIRTLDFVLVFSAAAIGLNVVVGLAGLLDLGYIAFFGFGGYVAAMLSDALFTTVHVEVPFLLVLPLAAVVAAVFGVIIGAPTLRLRGDYLAIVTLGFGEIFRVVANGWDGFTGGPNGISGIPDLEFAGFNFGESHQFLGIPLPRVANYYYLALLLLVFVVVVFRNLNDSRIGRAWVAIREDETAARAMGVNTVALKLLAFAIGASLAGLGGAVNAHLASQTDPSSYRFDYSALLLAAVVLGGMGTVPGAIIGATLLYVIPERLRFVQDYRLMLFGIALVVMMRFRPQGIWASRRRTAEFRDPDSGGDAMGGPLDAGQK